MSELVDIPMNGWSRERLAAGEKTATTRTERYGDPGDRFEVEGMVFEITHVVKVPLSVVCEHFWEAEGAESPAEFQAVWAEIHYKKGVQPEWEVWLHFFTEVKNA